MLETAECLARLDALHDAVLALAAENPERVYRRRHGAGPSCSYHPDPLNPDGCIIGAALRRIEHPVPARVEGSCSVVIAEHLLDDRVNDFVLIDEMTLRLSWFARVQLHQDEGRTWSDAVEIASTAVGWPDIS